MILAAGSNLNAAGKVDGNSSAGAVFGVQHSFIISVEPDNDYTGSAGATYDLSNSLWHFRLVPKADDDGEGRIIVNGSK